MSASLAINFLNHTYENPFMNASGVHCMSTKELDELKDSRAGAFITKSSTTVSYTHLDVYKRQEYGFEQNL